MERHKTPCSSESEYLVGARFAVCSMRILIANKRRETIPETGNAVFVTQTLVTKESSIQSEKGNGKIVANHVSTENMRRFSFSQ